MAVLPLLLCLFLSVRKEAGEGRASYVAVVGRMGEWRSVGEDKGSNGGFRKKRCG